MRILVVEGVAHAAAALELMLKAEGFNVYGTDNGEEAVDLARLYDYDLIVVSDAADHTVNSIIQNIRAAKVTTPVLALSALTGVTDKIKALGLGADDYMTKPFHKDELVARINALVRRSKGHAVSEIKVGDLTVNTSEKHIILEGKRVHLTNKEYGIIELLALRKGTCVTKEMLLNHLYGGMDEPEIKIIDVFMCKIRTKLKLASGGRNFFETVWGRGYVLREPVAEATAA